MWPLNYNLNWNYIQIAPFYYLKATTKKAIAIVHYNAHNNCSCNKKIILEQYYINIITKDLQDHFHPTQK